MIGGHKQKKAHLRTGGVWANTNRVSPQGQSLEFDTRLQTLHMNQVIHIVSFQIQKLQLLQKADIKKVRQAVKGCMELL